MKLLAVAALFASVSGLQSQHVEYKFDPVRDERARKFMGDLVLTQMQKFDEAQQTQLFIGKVGGKTRICQGFDDYAVFDLNKLNKLEKGTDKPYAVNVIQPGAKPAEDMPATSMIYDVCGSAFNPHTMKDKLNQKKLTQVTDDDFASCKKLGDDADTLGNMYLVKDGKCVQSFDSGVFSAKIEKKENEKDLKQEWKIQYTSLQKCSFNDKKQFEINILGSCDKTVTAPKLEATNIEQCKVDLQYKAKGACFVKYIPISKYLDMLSPFFGAIFIGIGLVMCFHGSHLISYVIAFLIGTGVCGFVFMIGYNFLDPEKAELWQLLVLLAVAILIGIVVSFATYYLVKEWAITVLAFWLGIMIALLILKIAQVSDQKLTLVACAVGGVIGVVLGRKLNDSIKQTGTAIIGAFIVIRGASMYLGNFPSEFNTGDIDMKVLNPNSGQTLYYTLGYLAAFIVLACVGTVYQRRKYPGTQKEDNLMDNEEESRICGLF